MEKQAIVKELNSALEFFERSTRPLTDEHSDFRPNHEQMTVAQQIAHTAQTVDWFFEGAFRPEGFDMDFAAHGKALEGIKSVSEARTWLRKSFASAIQAAESHSQEEWEAPMAEGPIMGGEPRSAIIGAIMDHTAHHRGALTVYSRVLGLKPPMPYGDM